MFFKILSKEKRLLRDIARKCNSVLFSQLEENEDKMGVYVAVRETLQDASMRLLGSSLQQAEEKWRGISLADMIERIKQNEGKDPQTVFFLLAEIHSRLAKKEEFKKSFEELLPEIPIDLLDVILFKNPKLNLQFRKD